MPHVWRRRSHEALRHNDLADPNHGVGLAPPPCVVFQGTSPRKEITLQKKPFVAPTLKSETTLTEQQVSDLDQ